MGEKWETRQNLRQEIGDKLIGNKLNEKHRFLTKKQEKQAKTGNTDEKTGTNRKLQEIQKPDKTRFQRDKISIRQHFGKC